MSRKVKAQVVLSEDELEAVNDWRRMQPGRIPALSEALRALVLRQLGQTRSKEQAA